MSNNHIMITRSKNKIINDNNHNNDNSNDDDDNDIDEYGNIKGLIDYDCDDDETFDNKLFQKEINRLKRNKINKKILRKIMK